MEEFFGGAGLTALATVILIDIVMSGDNAIIIGMAASGLKPRLRRRAIVIGIAVATVVRIMFAVVALELLAIIGLTLAGGLLLLWVAWSMWREVRAARRRSRLAADAPVEPDPNAPALPEKSLRQALFTIVAADISMSLDNILAVAGAAHGNVAVLVFGLVLSIALMGLASNFIAKLLERHYWLAYIGLAVVFYIAVRMIARGWQEVFPVLQEVAG